MCVVLLLVALGMTWADGIDEVESISLMVPLTSSSETEAILGRVPGGGVPSALLEGLEKPS